MDTAAFIFIIVFVFLAINAGLIIRFRIFAGKYPTKKEFIICNIIIIIISILFAILPKSNNECKVNIIINNKNSISEIIINRKNEYHLIKNEKLKLEDLSSSGFIAIKTETEALIVSYHDDMHLFKVTHRITIDIVDNQIFISSFPEIPIGTIISDIQKYDKVIELFK